MVNAIEKQYTSLSERQTPVGIPPVAGTVVEQAYAAMTNTQKAFGQHINRIDRSRFSDEGFRAEVVAFADGPAARAVVEALDRVGRRRDQAQARVEQVRSDLVRDGDAAAELRASRFWERTRRILDNADADDVCNAARKFMIEANRSEIGTLVQELPAYLQARGQMSDDWFDVALGQAVPEYASARAELTKADQALTITQYNAEALQRGFSECRPPTALVDPGVKYNPDK